MTKNKKKNNIQGGELTNIITQPKTDIILDEDILEESADAENELAATIVKKRSFFDRIKNNLGAKKAVKIETEKERHKVAETLNKIDSQLNMLSGHNNTLLEEVQNLRKVNLDLINEILKIRKREFISKIIAIISGTISVVLILLKILQWTI